MKRILAIGLTAALTLPLAALARAPYTPARAGEAVVRFSWRMNVTARENCRRRTQAELDALPVHMRTPEVCTRDVARYMLITRVDAAPADTVQLARGGVHGDRPVFVLEERVLPPGKHRIQIAVQRTMATSERSVLATLDTRLLLQPGHVQLVTLDADARRLTVRSPVPLRGERRASPAARQPHRREHDDDAEKRTRPREQRRAPPEHE